MKKRSINTIDFYPSLILFYTALIVAVLLTGCDTSPSSGKPSQPTYVSPSIDRNGHFRKGHIRMPVSTDKNAIQNRNRSRYYYHTRGKYRRK